MGGDTAFGFGKSIPGFEFLQQLAQVPSMPGGAGLHSWVAPTVDVEVLEQRIGELKAVQFWLEQNLLALKATVQALEVQKMTLSTLRGMDMNMSEVAKAFAMPQAATAAAQPVADVPVRWPFQAVAPEPKPEPESQDEPEESAPEVQPVADAMQWWGALTQQFQQIAQQTMSEATRHMPQAMEQMMSAGGTMPGTPADPARKKSARAAAGKKKSAASRKAASKTAAKKANKKSAPATRKTTRSAQKALGNPLAGNWPLPPSVKRSTR